MDFLARYKSFSDEGRAKITSMIKDSGELSEKERILILDKLKKADEEVKTMWDGVFSDLREMAKEEKIWNLWKKVTESVWNLYKQFIETDVIIKDLVNEITKGGKKDTYKEILLIIGEETLEKKGEGGKEDVFFAISFFLKLMKATNEVEEEKSKQKSP